MGKEIIIKPHHLADLVFGPQPKGVMVKWKGYDVAQDTEMQAFHEEMLGLPPDTPVSFTFGPDRNCNACPLNSLGERFDPALAAKDPKGPCDPDAIRKSKEKMYIRWLQEECVSDTVTLGVLPRKTMAEFKNELGY